MKSVQRFAKRTVDLVAAGTGLLVLSPVLILVAALIYLRMGSPVIYRQTRPGKNSEPFKLWKFRTMTNERNEKGELLSDAERLTSLGRWMRRCSIDELPQLFNVVCGTLSLVGPRPLLVRYLNRYSERQIKRMLAKPGITGWAQVNGRNALSWDERLEMDVWYVENWSFWLDMKILSKTLGAVLSSEGVKPGAGAELDEFWGSEGPPKEGPLAYPVEADEKVPSLMQRKNA